MNVYFVLIIKGLIAGVNPVPVTFDECVDYISGKSLPEGYSYGCIESAVAPRIEYSLTPKQIRDFENALKVQRV